MTTRIITIKETGQVIYECAVNEIFENTSDIHTDIDLILSKTNEYTFEQLIEMYDNWCAQ